MVWGVDDCMLFALAVSRTIKGRHVLPWLDGQWTDGFTARRYRLRAGKTMRQACLALASKNGVRRIAPAAANRGDIGLVNVCDGVVQTGATIMDLIRTNDGDEAAACLIDHGWICRTASGLVVRQRANIAWSID